VMSALLRITDLSQTSRHVRKVPQADIAPGFRRWKQAKAGCSGQGAFRASRWILGAGALKIRVPMGLVVGDAVIERDEQVRSYICSRNLGAGNDLSLRRCGVDNR
jgi:hypothetical protein